MIGLGTDFYFFLSKLAPFQLLTKLKKNYLKKCNSFIKNH